jgi:hypothetical protein
MAVSNGFWPLNLSVESLVLREIVPVPALVLLSRPVWNAGCGD